MKVWHMDSSKWDESQRTVLDVPINIGKVYREPITDGISKMILGLTYFPVGSGNVLHTHPVDQIIIITKGVAEIKTETETFLAYPGDVVYFPANEVHSHSAAPGHTMEHFAVKLDS